MKRRLFIVGFGPGSSAFLTPYASSLIEAADHVLASDRIGESIGLRGMSISEISERLASLVEHDGFESVSGNPIVVLVSGDSGCYSLAKHLVSQWSEYYQVELVPGISAISYLSAQIKVAYDDAVLTSLHGRNQFIVPKVTYNHKVFALTGGANSVDRICKQLVDSGLGEVSITVGERLSYLDEKITSGRAKQLVDVPFDDLSVIYIENPDYALSHRALSDSDFVRADIPMTKEEVRWVSVNKLRVTPGDIVYDIGTGTGSVAIELARKADDGLVYAIDSNRQACDLTFKNLTALKAFNVAVVHGEAPEVLADLPLPDKAFIGGSSNKLDEIVGVLIAKNPQIRIVTNAVTLQSLAQAQQVFEKYQLMTEIVCLNVSRANKVGSYDIMVANNPVYIISGEALVRDDSDDSDITEGERR
ncbi:MAG: precorrin-6y C5,15-methyltransferase (decarboxylating) subunit CbiE [Coriobacteriia bacterium]|nr:precorrin-6y C5,15-methyltransferase (decarboxylating) subunit CbiE [Coriobacteriia bacterium]